MLQYSTSISSAACFLLHLVDLHFEFPSLFVASVGRVVPSVALALWLLLFV